MHGQTIESISHSHDAGAVNPATERRTLYVLILTAVTMVAEIIAGFMTGSMALQADGWHMGTHAFALGIAFAAYWLARRFKGSSLFSFGTGKFGVLAGYTSSLFLGATSLALFAESILRFFRPLEIAFDQALLVSILGFLINAASIWLLHDNDHHHDHDDHHGEHHHHEQDHNYRAAYLHVVTDALTSVLAIAALLSGKFLGLTFLDPLMGIVGGILIFRWAYQLLKDTALLLLDKNNLTIAECIRTAIEADNDSKVVDLHVWPLSSTEMAAALSVVSGRGLTPSNYHASLESIPGLHHWTIEVHPCADVTCCCDAEAIR